MSILTGLSYHVPTFSIVSIGGVSIPSLSAITGIDLITMVTTFSTSLGGITKLVTAGSYVIGVLLIARAIYKFRQMADHHQSAQALDLSGPVVLILMGVVLIWWPTLLDVVTYTLWGSTSPTQYTISSSGQYFIVYQVIFKIVQLVGLISFLKGWYIITQVGHQGAPQGMMTKGITHIVGGICAYHIQAAIYVLMNTFGIPTT